MGHAAPHPCAAAFGPGHPSAVSRPLETRPLETSHGKDSKLSKHVSRPWRALYTRSPTMALVICDANYTDPVHARGIVDVIDSYARDPVGGGQGLRADVRAGLVPGLRAHPTSLVLLALADQDPIGVAVCFL